MGQKTEYNTLGTMTRNSRGSRYPIYFAIACFALSTWVVVKYWQASSAVEATEARIAEMSHQVVQLQQAKIGQVEKLESSLRDMETLKGEISTQNSELKELKNQLKIKEDEINELKEAAKVAEAKLATQEEEEKQIGELTKQIEELRLKVAEANKTEQNSASYKEVINSLTSNLQETKGQLHECLSFLKKYNAKTIDANLDPNGNENTEPGLLPLQANSNVMETNRGVNSDSQNNEQTDALNYGNANADGLDGAYNAEYQVPGVPENKGVNFNAESGKQRFEEPNSPSENAAGSNLPNYPPEQLRTNDAAKKQDYGRAESETQAAINQARYTDHVVSDQLGGQRSQIRADDVAKSQGQQPVVASNNELGANADGLDGTNNAAYQVPGVPDNKGVNFNAESGKQRFEEPNSPSDNEAGSNLPNNPPEQLRTNDAAKKQEYGRAESETKAAINQAGYTDHVVSDQLGEQRSQVRADDVAKSQGQIQQPVVASNDELSAKPLGENRGTLEALNRDSPGSHVITENKEDPPKSDTNLIYQNLEEPAPPGGSGGNAALAAQPNGDETNGKDVIRNYVLEKGAHAAG